MKEIKNAEIIYQPIVLDNTFLDIKSEKYAPLIKISANFVIDIVQLQKSIRLLCLNLDTRNDEIKKLPANDLNALTTQCFLFVITYKSNMQNFLEHTEKLILEMRNMILFVQQIKMKLPKLKIEQVSFTPDQEETFKKLRKQTKVKQYDKKRI